MRIALLVIGSFVVMHVSVAHAEWRPTVELVKTLHTQLRVISVGGTSGCVAQR